MAYPERRSPEVKPPSNRQRRQYARRMEALMRDTGEDGYGFRRGALIGGRLCYPDSNGDFLVYEESHDLQWLAYDPRRVERLRRLGHNVKSVERGVLRAILLDEIEHNDPSEETPVGLIDPLNLEYALKVETYAPAELVDAGLLDYTTHEVAYENLGLEEYIPDLRARSVADEPVYQVTPKGNTLVGMSTTFEAGQARFNFRNLRAVTMPV